MRGYEENQTTTFSYARLERRVPEGHPLRWLRPVVGGILASMTGMIDVFYMRASQGTACGDAANERGAIACSCRESAQIQLRKAR